MFCNTAYCYWDVPMKIIFGALTHETFGIRLFDLKTVTSTGSVLNGSF